MKVSPRIAALALATLLLPACRSTNSGPVASPQGNLAVRNNAASLLHDLLGDEANVSKLLIIKRERDELNRLIKEISAVALNGAKKLDQLEKADVTLNLRALELPPGERAARDSIGKARAGELLRASGDDFEFKLLLTQAEALGYGAHLAKVIALHEPKPEHAKIFSDVSQQMEELRGRVLKLMHSRNVARTVD